MPGPTHAARGDDTHAYVIRGGNPIHGSLKPGGNKNAALPMVAAALLGDGPVRLRNVPAIRDVHNMVELIAGLGAAVRDLGAGVWEINGSTVDGHELDAGLAGEIRASFLLAGPLLARWGRAVLPRPGGDRIGRRPLDTHIHAFLDFGATVDVQPDRYVLEAPGGLTATDLFLHEMSVMATENAVMAATLARGTTIIRNAASEPHVQELCHLVNAMGGQVEGIGYQHAGGRRARGRWPAPTSRSAPTRSRSGASSGWRQSPAAGSGSPGRARRTTTG